MSVKFSPSISNRLATTSIRGVSGGAKKTSTPRTSGPKDGIADDTFTLGHLKAPQGERSLGVSKDGKVTAEENKPNAKLAQKEEAPKTSASKPKLKTPRAGSDMAQMLEDMTNPAGVSSMSVNDKGLIVMETMDRGEQVTLKGEPEAPAERSRFRSADITDTGLFSFGNGLMSGGAAAAEGMMSLNTLMPGTAMLGGITGGMFPGLGLGALDSQTGSTFGLGKKAVPLGTVNRFP